MAETRSLGPRIASFIDAFNLQVPGGRWQLFEFCDLWAVPDVIKTCAQNTLTAQWTKRLPLLQEKAPAQFAADILLSFFAGVKERESWKVIDFCSGAGGPTPFIERSVNAQRDRAHQPPIPFYLSDIHPNLDAWMFHSSRSKNLSFIPQAVDATNPPFAAISSTTPGDKDAAFRRGFQHDGAKVFRLFSLSFHHFDDDAAVQVLESTLGTSDAFAIVELQERRLGSLVVMLLNFWLLLVMTLFWFWHDTTPLYFTYVLPVLPAVHCFDGVVSCLRTRSFGEFVALLRRAGKGERQSKVVVGGSRGEIVRLWDANGEWEISTTRVLHTWPIGYGHAIVGRKIRYAGVG